jgi:tungstate transport system ATP-binding protein
MEYIFNITNLKKEYGGRTVLFIEGLQIIQEQVTCIIGPSGSGKSTFLHMLNRVELPTSGSIEFNGYQYHSNEDLDISIRRQMAMVFQKPVLFKSSVFENIAYGLKLRKQLKAGIKSQVEEIAEIIGLKDKLKQNARTLSGGEAQRVALARAIILKPKVLFMDEATANLDPTNVKQIEDLVTLSNSKYKTTIIYATHNMNQARRMSDQLIFLLNGNLIETGGTKEIFENTKNQKTRDFIHGDMIW